MTDDERRVLTFERDHPTNDRVKEADIRVEFGFSWVRYRQILHRAIQQPAAVAEFPVVVRLVTERTDRQVAARSELRFVR